MTSERAVVCPAHISRTPHTASRPFINVVSLDTADVVLVAEAALAVVAFVFCVVDVLPAVDEVALNALRLKPDDCADVVAAVPLPLVDAADWICAVAVNPVITSTSIIVRSHWLPLGILRKKVLGWTNTLKICVTILPDEGFGSANGAGIV